MSFLYLGGERLKRIVHISDTHEQHDKLEIPDGDILIHSGDFTYLGYPSKITEFNNWLGTLSIPIKLVIAGNHDKLFQTQPEAARKLITNALYLDEEAVVVEGIKIFGSPWQPWFFDWAFNAQRGNDIQTHWDKIPDDTELLITHGPPNDILDRNRAGIKCGCANLRNTIEYRLKKLRLHAFGHIHEGYGKRRVNDVDYSNGSSCTDAYVPRNAPLVYEWYDNPDGWDNPKEDVDGREEALVREVTERESEPLS
jgi:Icc-related predicted phosphoesterase